MKVLVEASSVDVAAGGKLVSAAEEKLTAMLSAVRSSTDLMDAVARESREQACAIEQVNAAVRQLDEMTQHNAALVEETNAAIVRTEARATDLDDLVETFRIDADADALRSAA